MPKNQVFGQPEVGVIGYARAAVLYGVRLKIDSYRWWAKLTRMERNMN